MDKPPKKAKLSPGKLGQAGITFNEKIVAPSEGLSHDAAEKLRLSLLDFCGIVNQSKKNTSEILSVLRDDLPSEGDSMYYEHPDQANCKNIWGSADERHNANLATAIKIVQETRRLTCRRNGHESRWQRLVSNIFGVWDDYTDPSLIFPKKDERDHLARGDETYQFSAAHQLRMKNCEPNKSLAALSKPKPDIWFAFPIDHCNNDTNFSFESLKELEGNLKLVSCPLMSLEQHEDKFGQPPPGQIDDKLVCYPFLLIEVKKNNQKEKTLCYCQAANDCSASLSMLENLARPWKQHSVKKVLPVVAFTFVGPKAKLWLAFTCEPSHTDTLEKESRPNHHMQCIWKGRLDKLSHAVQLCRILDNLLSWALREHCEEIKRGLVLCRYEYLQRDLVAKQAAGEGLKLATTSNPTTPVEQRRSTSDLRASSTSKLGKTEQAFGKSFRKKLAYRGVADGLAGKLNFNEKVIPLKSAMPFGDFGPGKTVLEAPSTKSGLSAKPKANVGTKMSNPRHATKSGQVDARKSTKPGSSETQNDEDDQVLNGVRRRSTGSSPSISGGPTISQKCSGGRAPIDRHEYIDDSRSSSTKNKASSSNVKIAANHLSPPNVPSHFSFGGSQASLFGSRNASPRGWSFSFGARESDNSASESPLVLESSNAEGQNELSTCSIFGSGFVKPVKGQRKCTFKVPRGTEYTLWLSKFDIVSDGTIYSKGSRLIDRGGKSLNELEPDLPDKVRACEIREGQKKQRFWLDFVHTGHEQYEEILKRAESDEENEDKESEAEKDEDSSIEDEENEDEESETEKDEDSNIEDEENEDEESEAETDEDSNIEDNEDDDDSNSNSNSDEASENDNSDDDTSESGECDIRENEELMIDLEKIVIEQLRSEGREVDWEKLGRNYRVG